MKENRDIEFIKTTVMGGLLFLIPVVFLIFILSQAVDYMLVIAGPMADWISVDTIGGVAPANLIAIVIVILIYFIAGLVGRNAMASGLVKKTRIECVDEDSGIHTNQGYQGRPG